MRELYRSLQAFNELYDGILCFLSLPMTLFTSPGSASRVVYMVYENRAALLLTSSTPLYETISFFITAIRKTSLIKKLSCQLNYQRILFTTEY